MRPDHFLQEVRGFREPLVFTSDNIGRFLFGLTKVYFFGVIIATTADGFIYFNDLSLFSIWIYCIFSWVSLYLIFFRRFRPQHRVM